jgi:ubiquinone/menaquinone biosynthesis C-methylase UbiE
MSSDGKFENIWRQNIWETQDQRQRRRAELIRSLVKKHGVETILDIGCAEGYITKYISEGAVRTIGIDSDLQHLRVAVKRVKAADFINASIEYTPFRNNSFDSITILEVMEHLPGNMQQRGLEESFQLLQKNGVLIISIPYKENIIKTNCIHCGKVTPLYGHLHSMDEEYIKTKFGNNSKLVLRRMYRLPNIQMISCKRSFALLPFRLWLFLNDLLGTIKKGYWAVLCFSKE